MSGRIVIPIYNLHGQLVAYAGRALDNREPKYKLPAGFRKVLELFNLQRAMATGSRIVIVVEGYFDCVRVHQAGFPCVVALMGSSLSAAQESGLRRHCEGIVLMLDGDAAGRAATDVIATRLGLALGAGSSGVGLQPTRSVISLRHSAVVGGVGCRNEGAMVKQSLSPE